MRKGFTLIEIIMSLGIMTLLFSTLLLGKTNEEKKLGLQRSAYQLAQDLREAQEKAMGAERAVCGNNTRNFGIAFDENWKDYYILFTDCDENYTRGVGDQDIKKVYLEKGVEISDLAPASPLDIVFKAPDPIVYINYIGGEPWGTEAVITLSLNSQTKNIKVNSAGRIEIE